MTIHELCTQVACSRVDLLSEDLASHNEAVQIRAARLMSELKGPDVVAPLVERLRRECLEEVQAELCRAVAAIGAREELPELTALLERSEDAGVKAAAADAISALSAWNGPVAARATVDVPADAKTRLLQATYGEQAAEAALAADALGRLGSPEAVSRLIELMSDPRDEVRTAAAAGLRMAGQPTPAALKALAGAFLDGGMWVQAEAFHAVAKLGHGANEEVRRSLVAAFLAAVPALAAGKPRPWWQTSPAMAAAIGTEQEMVSLARLLLDLPYSSSHSPLAGCLEAMAAPDKEAAALKSIAEQLTDKNLARQLQAAAGSDYAPATCTK